MDIVNWLYLKANKLIRNSVQQTDDIILLGTNFSIVNNTAFDTTIINTLNITAEWGQADPLNSIYAEHFVLTKIY